MLSHHQQIQASVAGLMIQWFASYRLKVSNCSLVPRCSPKVSHHLSAILEMKTTIFANCSRVLPRSAVSSMQKGSFDRSTNKCSKWNWNGIRKALCSTLKRCNHGNHGPAIFWISNDWLLNTVSLYSIWSYWLYCLCFTWSQGYAAEVSLYSIDNRAFASHVLNAQRRLFSGRLFPHYQVDLTSHQFKMRLNHWIPKQKKWMGPSHCCTCRNWHLLAFGF